MDEKVYVYTGPLSGVSLRGGKEVMLHPGNEVTLPDDNEFVKTLVAMGRLKEAASASPAPVNRPQATAKKEVKDVG